MADRAALERQRVVGILAPALAVGGRGEGEVVVHGRHDAILDRLPAFEADVEQEVGVVDPDGARGCHARGVIGEGADREHQVGVDPEGAGNVRRVERVDLAHLVADLVAREGHLVPAVLEPRRQWPAVVAAVLHQRQVDRWVPADG